jgi:hypothetical protein
MVNYSATYGRLPPAAVRGKNGEPLLSWRVQILPYIEEPELYREFHLDEPWDSPHNLSLLPRMPATYAPPAGKAWMVPPHHTVCKVFVGRGAAFEGAEGLRLQSETKDGSWRASPDFPDGISFTFLVVEAGVPVPWTKPEDLPFDPDGPLPDLRCLFSDMFRAGMADGSMTFVSKKTKEATLRAAITRNGGEKFDFGDFRP